MATVTKKIGVEEYVENFMAENAALRRKLQSKAEALIILSKELDQCRTERDQFKLMAEQLQDRYTSLKKKSFDMGFSRASLYSTDTDCYDSGNSLMEILNESKEKNKAMKIEIEDLRQKLRDANGDVKVLRLRVNQQKNCHISSENQNFPSHQKEEFVQQLEIMNMKCTQMEADLQSVLDEKEELVTERDAYKCKVHRLNHELNTLLKGNGKNIVDVDALVMENRYLQDRLQQAEEEKELMNQGLSKYKSMLDKKRSKGTVKLGANNSTGMVMTHRQDMPRRYPFHPWLHGWLLQMLPVQFSPEMKLTVQQLLEHGTSAQLPNTHATLADMKSLCLALLEALSDKSLAFSHQKKANRILARRVSELEQRLDLVQGGSVCVFPSQVLLEGYSSSEVDRDVNRILAEESTDSEGETVDSHRVGVSESAYTRINVDGMKIRDSAKKTLINLPKGSAPINETSENCEGVQKNISSKNSGNSDGKTAFVRTQIHHSSSSGDSLCLSPLNDTLPLQLQRLVQKALDEIKQEQLSNTGS